MRLSDAGSAAVVHAACMHVSGLYYTILSQHFSEAARRVPPQSALLSSVISALRLRLQTNLAVTGETEKKKRGAGYDSSV